MKELIQWILLGLFVGLIVLVLIPSSTILFGIGGESTVKLQEPPTPPVPPNPLTLAPLDPKLDLEAQVKVYTQQVNAYTQQVAGYAQQVSAYTQQVNVYKTFAESTGKSRQAATYELVVKNTLLSLLNTFVAFLLGYVFVKAGANMVDNFIRAKNGQPVESLKLF